MHISCDICGEDAKGEITYEDGEILVGCPDCILDIAGDSKKEISSIHEYSETDLQFFGVD